MGEKCECHLAESSGSGSAVGHEQYQPGLEPSRPEKDVPTEHHCGDWQVAVPCRLLGRESWLLVGLNQRQPSSTEHSYHDSLSHQSEQQDEESRLQESLVSGCFATTLSSGPQGSLFPGTKPQCWNPWSDVSVSCQLDAVSLQQST